MIIFHFCKLEINAVEMKMYLIIFIISIMNHRFEEITYFNESFSLRLLKIFLFLAFDVFIIGSR